MKKLDLKNLPKLGKNDAYCLDKKGNIGVLHYIGDVEDSYFDRKKRYYDLDGKPQLVISNNNFKKPEFFGETKLCFEKQTGVFALIDPFNSYPYLFIPDEKTLLELFGRLNDDKYFYTVFDSLKVSKNKTRIYAPSRDRKIFDNENDALEYFNVLKKKVYDELISLKERAKEMEKDAKARVDDKLPSPNDIEILAGNAEIGLKYHCKDMYGKWLKKAVIIAYVDVYGFPHLTNDNILSPNTVIISDENYLLYKKINNNDEFVKTLKEFEFFLKRIDTTIKKIDKINNPFKNMVNDISVEEIKRYFDKLCDWVKSDLKLLENEQE